MLKAREFHQIAGRAGRAGFDTAGTVVVQAPEHVVENHRLLQKAGDDPKKLKRVQRKKAPEGQSPGPRTPSTGWWPPSPRPLVSRMRVTPLDAAQRDRPRRGPVRGDAAPAPRQPRGRPCAGPAWSAGRSRSYRSLLAAGVVERDRPRRADGRTVRLTEDLQLGFALNQPLSTYALAAFDVLDPESPTYALDVVSVVEATLEDPRPGAGAPRSTRPAARRSAR